MQISTRARLTFYFTSLFGVLVAALSVAAFLLVRNDAYSKLDAALQVAVGATAMSAEHEMNEHSQKNAGEADLQSVLDQARNGSLQDTQVLVREDTRQVAYKDSERPAADLRAISPEFLQNDITHNGLRLAHRELSVPKFHAVYQIYSAKPVDATLRALARVRLSLLILVPIGLAVAALAGSVLAKKSLAPLQELTRTIDAITSSDLSARVKADKAEGDISRLGSRFNSLLDKLENAFHDQRRFMEDASHELRTPLTVALTATQVTSRDPCHTLRDCEESLEIVEQQMLRLKRIVQDMFFLSQADAGSLQLNCKEMYLDDAVSEACRAAKTLALAKQQSFDLGALPEAKCNGDRDLLKQAVLILLDNAVKFTPSGGRIRVNLSRRENSWICSITDSGPGISETAQPHIFERFFRANPLAGEKTPGAGLGLPIAKSIVESHGGTLTLKEPRPGLTTFEIAIPLAHELTSPGESHANSSAVRM
jgi:heavy metal sensor kinase